MQTIGFQETIEALSREDNRYNPEAYLFLRDSLEATIKRRKKSRKETSPHVGAIELLEGSDSMLSMNSDRCPSWCSIIGE